MVDVVADRVVVEYQVMAQPYLRAMADLDTRTQKTYGSVLSGGARMEQGLRCSLLNSAAAADMLGRSLGMVTAALGTREVMRYADSWTAAGNKISAMGTPLEDQQRRLQQLADVAVDTRANFDATVQTFARLEMSTKGLGKSQTELLRITETINKAFAVGGAAPSEQFAASLQLSQALSSGILGGDELRSVRENAPVIARAIADVMGTTVGNLKNLGEQGQLTSAVVIEALERLGPEVDKAFGKTAPTIGQALENLRTRLTEFVGTASQTSGSGQVIAGSIDLIAQNFDKLADAAIVVGAVFAGRYASGLANAAGAEAQLLAAHANGTAVLINSAEASRQRAAAAVSEAANVVRSAEAERAAAAARVATVRETEQALIANAALARQQIATEEATKAAAAATLVAAEADAARAAEAVQAAAIRESATRNEITGRAQALAAVEAASAADVAADERASAARAMLAEAEFERQRSLSAALATEQAARASTKTLAAAEIDLATADAAVSSASARAAAAQEAYGTVLAATTLRMQALNAITKAWQATLTMFGGPVGLAITGLTIAMIALADTTDKVSEATERAKSAEDGFWKIIDRTTLKIKEQKKELVDLQRERLRNTVADAPRAMWEAGRDVLQHASRNSAWGGSKEASRAAADFLNKGDFAPEAAIALEKRLRDIKTAGGKVSEETLNSVVNLENLAEQFSRNRSELAVLNGNATPRDIKNVRSSGGEDASAVSLSSTASSRSDAFTKAVEAAKERTAALQVESQVAGKSVYEQEKAKSALELRTAADKDLAKAQEKRAQITSKSAAATKQADAELASAKTIHDQRIKQVDALADALARQASAADKAKKAASTDKKENSDATKKRRETAVNDVDTLLAEANRDLTKVQTEAAVRAAGTFDSYTKARVAQIVSDANAEVAVIGAKAKEEQKKLNDLKPGWSGYKAASEKVDAATKSRKQAVTDKAQSDIADEFLASTVRETQAMREEMETLGMTRAEADRFLTSKRLLTVAAESEANGQDEVARKAKAAAADYDAASRAVERAADANDKAVQASDALRDSAARVAVNFRDAKSAAASLLSTLANAAANDAVEAIFGKRGTPIGGTGNKCGGGLLGLAWDAFKDIPGYANGTPNAPGGLAIVGERGPELLNMPRGSQIIPDVSALAGRVSSAVQNNNAMHYTNNGGNILVNGDPTGQSLRVMKAMLDQQTSQFDMRWMAMWQKFNRTR